MSGIGLAATATPLVGRGAQLNDLAAWLDDARAGASQVVIIGGEAGIGKSRLLAEFLDGQASPAVTVAVSRCLELGPDGPPFAPVTMLLRSLVGQLGRDEVARLAGVGVADLALLAPELGSGATEQQFGRNRLFDAFTTLVERCAEDQPLVLVFEDLHWSDPSTRDLIGFVIRSLADSRLLVVLTYRADELPRSHPLTPWLAELARLGRTHRMTLDRLPDADIDELIRLLVGQVPEHTSARIRRRSEGIPFFVEELTTCCDAEPGMSALPDSLRDLMLARLDRLTDRTRTVVRMASAANSQVDHRVLVALVDASAHELNDSLREAVNAQILVVDGSREGYAFRHALMREAVHTDLLPGEHARLHARYAGALEARARPEQAGEVAHHWISAHEVDKSFAWSLRAADYSRSVYAWQEELTHLDRALDLWDQVSDPQELSGMRRLDVLARAGRAAGDLGRSEQSVAFLDAAMADVDERFDGRTAAELLIRRARQCENPREDPLRDLTRALELAPSGSEPHAAALASIAAYHMLSGDFARAKQWAERAISAAEASPELQLSAAHAHNTLGCVLFYTGHQDDGVAHLERSREIAEAVGDWPSLLRYYGNSSDALIGAGRYSEATAMAREGRRTSAEHGLMRTMGAFLSSNEAEAMRLAGQWDTALAVIDESLQLEPPAVTRGALHLHRAIIRMRRGETDGATDDLDAATEYLGFALTQPQYRLPVIALQAELEARRGDYESSLDRLAEAPLDRDLELPAAQPFTFAYARVLADALVAGVPPEPVLTTSLANLRALVGALDRLAEHPGWQLLLRAQVELVEELAGPSNAETPSWETAVAALLAAEGLRYETAYAQLRWAEQAFAGGDRVTGREALLAAWETIDELRADSLRPAATQLSHAARIPLRRVERGAGLLTAREREVLDLVTAGKSNRAIADELFISVKTTSVHVSHILAKIGASSRTEAAAWAHSRS